MELHVDKIEMPSDMLHAPYQPAQEHPPPEPQEQQPQPEQAPPAAPNPMDPLVSAQVLAPPLPAMPVIPLPSQSDQPTLPPASGGAFARPNKRHWLMSDQVAKIEDAFSRWGGNWRGKEPQLHALAAELGIKVEKLKKRVDYMRRSREAKAQRDQDTHDGMRGLSGDLLDDDSFLGGKRNRTDLRRFRAEPYFPPKCLFSSNGCVANPEHGQFMTVVLSTCGHRFVCLDCFNDGFNLDQYLQKVAACPTCREGPLTKESFVPLLEIERLSQPCKWCRVKNRNLAFVPCAHVSDYCTDCFDQAGSGFYKEETCPLCEHKYHKAVEV